MAKFGRLSEAREYKQGDNAQLTYKQKFEFDRFGNMYRKAASNQPTGQQNPLPFTPIEDTDISKTTNRFATQTTYDDAGQVVTDNKFRSMSFAYDANGRQVKATKTNSPDAWTVYDALGNRVATKINDIWQYVVYDAFGKLVAEYGIPSEGTGGIKYIQQDWQGSVRTVTNNNGFVVSRTDYQAFGEEIGFGTGLRSIEQGYNTDKVARQGYGLTERDDATGLNHAWFRKNETQAGRWTSPDPYKGSMSLGDPQSFNRYSYVQNDPVNFADPTGLCTFRITIATSTSNPPGNAYSNATVLQSARNEISRIFNQAGHQVTFDSNTDAAATYGLTLQGGTSGNSIASGYLGTGVGSLWAGQLAIMAGQPGGSNGTTNQGIGLAIGRVAAHEAITHNFLMYGNGPASLPFQHTATGLTRQSFGTSLFSQNAAGQYQISAILSAELAKLCLPQNIPNNYAGGGGGFGGGGYSGGGFGGGGGHPSWWHNLQDFLVSCP